MSCMLYATFWSVVEVSNVVKEWDRKVFLENTERLQKYDNIFIVADTSGINLIAELWRLDPTLKIVIGSPDVLKTVTLWCNVSAVSQLCDFKNRTAMWHRLTEDEATGLLMSDLLVTKQTDRYAQLAALFRLHPLYKFVIPFSPNPISSAIVVATIGSPRLYYNSERPNRLSKVLRRFDAASPDLSIVDRDKLKAAESSGLVSFKFQSLLRAWHDSGIAVGEEAPANRWPHRLLKPGSSNFAKQVHTACRRYLMYVFIHWMHALASTQRKELKFKPEEFFKKQDEIDFYRSLTY